MATSFFLSFFNSVGIFDFGKEGYHTITLDSLDFHLHIVDKGIVAIEVAIECIILVLYIATSLFT